MFCPQTTDESESESENFIDPEKNAYSGTEQTKGHENNMKYNVNIVTIP